MVRQLLSEQPVVALLGARQVGKTTLARFEIKRTVSPRVTTSMQVALHDLKLDSLDIIHAGKDTFPLAPNVRSVSLARLGDIS